MRPKPRAILVVVLLTSAGLLAGCDPAVEPPQWQARLLGDQLQIAACDAIDGDEITAYVEQSTGPRWRKFWSASGQLQVDAGDHLLAGEDSAQITHQEYDGSLLAPDSTVIVFLKRDGEQVERAPFELTGDGSWVGSLGTSAESLCE